MDPNDEIQSEFLPLIRIYKSGRVDRLEGLDRVPAGLDEATGVTTRDAVIDPATTVSARLYLPSDGPEPGARLPVLVYFHGGGFCAQSAFSPTYAAFLTKLSAMAGVVVVSVEYRLAPEHPVPAGYADSWAALKWVASHADGSGTDPALASRGDLRRLVLAGDSSGANIAHHLAVRAGSGLSGLDPGVRIRKVVLFHPYFWGKEPVGSEITDPGFRDWMEQFWIMVCPGSEGADDPWLNPLRGDEGLARIEGLAGEQVLVTVAEKDPLRERGRAYVDRLKASRWRGAVELFETKGEGHVFHLVKPECEKTMEKLEKVVEFLNQ